MTQQTIRSGLAVVFSLSLLAQAAHAGEPGTPEACRIRKDVADKIKASPLSRPYYAAPNYVKQLKPFVSVYKRVGFDIGPIDWHRTIDWNFGPRASFSSVGFLNYKPNLVINTDGTWNYSMSASGHNVVNASVETCWFTCKMLAWLTVAPMFTMSTRSLVGDVDRPVPKGSHVGIFMMPLGASLSFSIGHIPPFGLTVDFTGTFNAWNQVMDSVTTTETIDAECLKVPRKVTLFVDSDMEAKARATATRWFTVVDILAGYADIGPRVSLDLVRWKGKASPDVEIDFKTPSAAVKNGDFFSSVKGPSNGSIRFAWQACIRVPFASDPCYDDDFLIAPF